MSVHGGVTVPCSSALASLEGRLNRCCAQSSACAESAHGQSAGNRPARRPQSSYCSAGLSSTVASSGGGLFNHLALCNNLESVRRHTLPAMGRLHGDGNHRLLRMHRNMTGRHLELELLQMLQTARPQQRSRPPHVPSLPPRAQLPHALLALTSSDFLSFTLPAACRSSQPALPLCTLWARCRRSAKCSRP